MFNTPNTLVSKLFNYLLSLSDNSDLLELSVFERVVAILTFQLFEKGAKQILNKKNIYIKSVCIVTGWIFQFFFIDFLLSMFI